MANKFPPRALREDAARIVRDLARLQHHEILAASLLSSASQMALPDLSLNLPQMVQTLINAKDADDAWEASENLQSEIRHLMRLLGRIRNSCKKAVNHLHGNPPNKHRCGNCYEK